MANRNSEVFGRDEGFAHKGQLVFALQYELAPTPPSWLIVWLDSDGNSLHPLVRPAGPPQADRGDQAPAT